MPIARSYTITEAQAAKPYLCLIRYEDGSRTCDAFDTIEEAVELKTRAATGMSAMLSVEILVKLEK